MWAFPPPHPAGPLHMVTRTQEQTCCPLILVAWPSLLSRVQLFALEARMGQGVGQNPEALRSLHPSVVLRFPSGAQISSLGSGSW